MLFADGTEDADLGFEACRAVTRSFARVLAASRVFADVRFEEPPPDRFSTATPDAALGGRSGFGAGAGGGWWTGTGTAAGAGTVAGSLVRSGTGSGTGSGSGTGTAMATELEAPRPTAEIVIEGEIRVLSLRRSFEWWGVVGLVWLLPGGTYYSLALLASGFPIASDAADIAIGLRVRDAATGRILARHEVRYEERLTHNVWGGAGGLLTGPYAHPEEALEGACGRLVTDIILNRWTYLRLAAGAPGAPR